MWTLTLKYRISVIEYACGQKNMRFHFENLYMWISKKNLYEPHFECDNFHVSVPVVFITVVFGREQQMPFEVPGGFENFIDFD